MAVRELIAPSPTAIAPGRCRAAAVAAAALATASIGTHILMLVTMPGSTVTHAVVLAMAMACLWCGVRLVRTPRVKEWLATAVMGAVMVAAHLTMSGGRTHGHAMTHTAATGPALHADAMSTALLLAVAEVVVAVWAIWRLTGPVWPGNGDAGPERHGFQRSRGMPPRI